MTDLQQSLVDFIAAHTAARGEAPSLDEIGRGFQARPNRHLERSLELLAAAGRVRLVHGRWQISGNEAQLHFDLAGGAAGGSPKR